MRTPRRRAPQPALRVVRNGLRDLMCRACGSTERVVQVDWVPVQYPVVGVRVGGTLVVDNTSFAVEIDWENFDPQRQELLCKHCGHRWRVPDHVGIEVTEEDGS